MIQMHILARNHIIADPKQLIDICDDLFAYGKKSCITSMTMSLDSRQFARHNKSIPEGYPLQMGLASEELQLNDLHLLSKRASISGDLFVSPIQGIQGMQGMHSL